MGDRGKHSPDPPKAPTLFGAAATKIIQPARWLSYLCANTLMALFNSLMSSETSLLFSGEARASGAGRTIPYWDCTRNRASRSG
jgi:hypothetical protein